MIAPSCEACGRVLAVVDGQDMCVITSCDRYGVEVEPQSVDRRRGDEPEEATP